MWIRTQNKQRIVNCNQIVDIFIDKTGTKIYAELSIDRDFILLGEYKDRDTCLKVLENICIIIGTKTPGVEMPLGGEFDAWCESISELARIYITTDFRR